MRKGGEPSIQKAPFCLLVSKHIFLLEICYRETGSHFYSGSIWQTDNIGFIFKQFIITKFHYVKTN